MKEKSFSLSNKLRNISNLFLALFLLVCLIGVAIFIGSFKYTVNTWITEKITDPYAPIGPDNLSIPYSTLFFDNIIAILIIPIVFIMATTFAIVTMNKKFIQREIVNFYRTIGIIHTESINGRVRINSDHFISIFGNFNGSFILKKDNEILSFSTMDELYWKIMYIIYLEKKGKN